MMMAGFLLLLSLSPLQQARQATDELLAALKTTLQAELAARGPAGAIAVCRDTAQGLLDQVSRKYGGIYIRRVSRRWRNPADIPTPDEDSLLEVLETRSQAGSLPREWVDTLILNGIPFLRYARPLVVDGLCLACHGEVLAPEVERILRLRYPHDRARGYRPGDFRGMVVVKLPLQGAQTGGSP